MEFKAGQVWQQRSCGIEVVAVNDKECVLNTKDGFFLMSISGAEILLMNCVLLNEPESSLSDIEIVQKALSFVSKKTPDNQAFIEISDCLAWCVYDCFDKGLFSGEGIESLLTWAKQTIGE